MDADAFSPVHGDGMDAGGRATQERLPNALSKSPAAAHGLAGQNARQVPRRVAFSLLRASCPPPFGPASPFAPLLRRSGYFLLATQEKVTQAPKALESICFSLSKRCRRLATADEERLKRPQPATGTPSINRLANRG